MHLHQTSIPAGSIAAPSTLRAPQPCACGRFATASAPLFASPAQPVRRPQRQCSLRVASTSLDDLSLFQGGSAMPSTSSSSGREAAGTLEDVPLNSEVRSVPSRADKYSSCQSAAVSCRCGTPCMPACEHKLRQQRDAGALCTATGRLRLHAFEGRTGRRRLPDGRRHYSGCSHPAGRPRRCETELGIFHW